MNDEQNQSVGDQTNVATEANTAPGGDHIAASIALSAASGQKEPGSAASSETADEQMKKTITALKGVIGGDARVLKDGRKFTMGIGNGRTVVQATREAEGAEEMLIACTMRLLLEVEGEGENGAYGKLFIEELLALGIGDYMKVQRAFAEENF